MKLFRLVHWMKDVVPEIHELDGYLFFDRFELGEARLRFEVAGRYNSLAEAQSWMNIVLLDEFISETIGDDWDPDDPLVDEFLSIFKAAWTFQIRSRYPEAKFTIQKMYDNESGDIGLQLVSKKPSD